MLCRIPIDTDWVQITNNFLSIVLTEFQHEIINEVSEEKVKISATELKFFFQDGPMCFTDNQGGAPNYHPNSFNGPETSKTARNLEPTFKISGDVYRYDTGDEDNFTQSRIFWNSVLDESTRNRLVSNIASHLGNALEFIQERAVHNFSQVSSDFGRKLNEALQANDKRQAHRGQRRV